ncbi:MAG: peptide deformylase, partial [Leucobacter sp.]|nr:peptide deformylase [Leucobacter sp.]
LNPQLVEVSGEPQPTGEGCLSVPDLWFDVMRYPYAKVRGIDLYGNEVIIEGEGLKAQALQHECDHLDGKLYISRLERAARGEAMRQIRTSDWF